MSSSSSVARNAFLTVAYGTELALVVIASLALFSVVAAENWWIIMLNAWQLLFTGGFLMYLFGDILQTDCDVRNFVVTVITGSLILVVLHSVWQANTEDAGLNSTAMQTYRAFAGARVALFTVSTIGIVNAVFFRTHRK